MITLYYLKDKATGNIVLAENIFDMCKNMIPFEVAVFKSLTTVSFVKGFFESSAKEHDKNDNFECEITTFEVPSDIMKNRQFFYISSLYEGYTYEDSGIKHIFKSDKVFYLSKEDLLANSQLYKTACKLKDKYNGKFTVTCSDDNSIIGTETAQGDFWTSGNHSDGDFIWKIHKVKIMTYRELMKNWAGYILKKSFSKQ